MVVNSLVEPLLALALFRGLKPSQLTEIARLADRVVFRAGDFITEENKVGDAAILIVSGDCIRIDGNGSIINPSRGEPLPEGSLIAELAMLVEITHVSTIIAQGPVRALRFPRADMLELMHKDLSLAEHFSQTILARLQALAGEINAVESAFAGWGRNTPLQIAPPPSSHVAAAS